MADRQLRSLERAADRDDPDAKARYQRHLCRPGRHAWKGYKGGERECKACGQRLEAHDRELGAMPLNPGDYPVLSPEELLRALERFAEPAVE